MDSLGTFTECISKSYSEVRLELGDGDDITELFWDQAATAAGLLCDFMVLAATALLCSFGIDCPESVLQLLALSLLCI